jgi:alpha-galactosidase
VQITIAGGGSRQWGPTLISDIVSMPSLSDVDLVLQDIDPTWLPKMEDYTRAVAKQLGVGATVRSTTDPRAALDGADYVVVTISTGGFDSMRHDLEVPARHGIRQSVGDSVGPGGISRALRNIPVLLGIARHMEQVCPDALLLNITNPMTCLTRALNRETSIETVGLCHEVVIMGWLLAIACGVSTDVVHPAIVGINHLPLITALDIDGADGFPLVHAARQNPDAAWFADEHALKLAILDEWGVLPSAGDRHVAEFFPGFLTEESEWGKRWGVALTDIAEREHNEHGYREALDRMVAGTKKLPTHQSGEMVAPIIDSITTGTRRVLPLNLPNAGQAPDLPADVVVETMCIVDGDGVCGGEPVRAPRVATEWLRRHVAVQELVVEAAVTGDRALAREAFHLDPLAGRGDRRATDAMVDELLDATSPWLGHLGA